MINTGILRISTVLSYDFRMNHADELIENCKNYFIGQFSLIKFSRTLSVFDMFPDLTYTARASDPC